MRTMKLKNKFALVTGASTGIGRAIAIEFAKVYVMKKGKKPFEGFHS